MAKTSEKKFTKAEKSWIMYDWANSVYATNIMTALFPLYFGNMCKAAGADNLVLWSYGTSIATAVVAVLAPFLGALGDHKGYKKKLFGLFLALGVVFTMTAAFFEQYQMLLVGYILSRIGFSGSCLFYDSFLTDVTTNERMDRVSSWGYAMGYIGGSTIPFVISIVILLVMGFDNPTAFKLVLALTSLWWAVFSIPMLLNVHQTHYVETKGNALVSSALSNLLKTAKDIFAERGIFLFILAYFFYIDGVGTIISVSTSYGDSLGLGQISMVLALLVTQIVAMVFSILFGKLSERFSSISLLLFAIAVYFVITLVGFGMGFNIEIHTDANGVVDAGAKAIGNVLFWVVAVLVGTVQGGIQAISRSYFGKLIPARRSNEFFGFFDIFGKFAAVIGPALIAVFAQATGYNSIGVLSLAILFAIGFCTLFFGRKTLHEQEKKAENEP